MVLEIDGILEDLSQLLKIKNLSLEDAIIKDNTSKVFVDELVNNRRLRYIEGAIYQFPERGGISLMAYDLADISSGSKAHDYNIPGPFSMQRISLENGKPLASIDFLDHSEVEILILRNPNGFFGYEFEGQIRNPRPYIKKIIDRYLHS